MTPDLLQLIIANAPNYAGFVLLAWVQFATGKRQSEQYTELWKAYQELIDLCATNRLVTHQQATDLKRPPGRK